MSTSKPESSGPPLRALAMVLISLAILFAGLGFASLGDSDSDDTAVVATSSSAATTAPTGSAAARTTAPAGGTAGTASPTSSATRTSPSVDPASVPVRVLNNSTVTGLAGQTATKLTSAGWTVSETGNYRDGTISETTVYYGTSAGEKEAATEIADLLGVSAEPRFAGIKDSAPGVIVIVTSTG